MEDQNENKPEESPEPPPRPDSTPAPTSSTPTGSTVSSDPGPPLNDADSKMWAMLAHLLPIVASFIAPLIIWLIFKDRSKYVDEHGKEALNFQITMAIALVISFLSIYACIGMVLFPAVCIVEVVFCILAGLEAQKGNSYKYPFALRLVK